MKKLLCKIKKINGNDRIIIKNLVGSFLVKGGALIISLFTMPAYMRYFEDQQVLGLWFTILSVLTWILTFDLGIGNGLRNKLVESISSNNTDDIKKYISSSYFIVGVWVVIIIVLGYIIFPFINWNEIFNIAPQIISKDTLLNVTMCVFIGIMLQFLLRLITSVLYALQKSAVNNLLALITSIMQLAFVLCAPSFDIETNLKMLSYAFIACTNIPLIIATIVVFKTKLKECFPTRKYFSKKYAYSILKLGGVFFWCQIMYMVIMNTNEFFISNYLGPEYVVEYQIYNKLFTLVGTLFTLALMPVWSTITKAIAEKNYIWLKQLYRNLKKLSLVAIVCEFLMVPFLQIIVNVWLGNDSIEINSLSAIIFAMFGGIFIYQTVLSTVVCGIGKMKLQAICYTVGVVLKFVIIHIGISIFNNWIIIVFANLIILLPYCIIQQVSLDRYIKNELNQEKSNLNKLSS